MPDNLKPFNPATDSVTAAVTKYEKGAFDPVPKDVPITVVEKPKPKEEGQIIDIIDDFSKESLEKIISSNGFIIRKSGAIQLLNVEVEFCSPTMLDEGDFFGQRAIGILSLTFNVLAENVNNEQKNTISEFNYLYYKKTNKLFISVKDGSAKKWLIERINKEKSENPVEIEKKQSFDAAENWKNMTSKLIQMGPANKVWMVKYLVEMDAKR